VSPPGHNAPAPHNEEQIVGRIAVDEGAWISATRAFSSEVETGSVKKTRQIKNLEPRFDSIEAEKALGL
jgi:hypothetical protein